MAELELGSSRASESSLQPERLRRSPDIPIAGLGESNYYRAAVFSDNKVDHLQAKKKKGTELPEDSDDSEGRSTGGTWSSWDISTSRAFGTPSSTEALTTRFQCREGLCEKQCPAVVFFGLLWQRRFLRLQSDGSLYYHFDQNRETSQGVVLMSDVQKDLDQVPRVKRKGRVLSLRVHAKGGRCYRFRFADEDEARGWEKAVHSHLA